MSKMHVLKRTQHLSIGLDKAWDFFSDPKNLPRITPPNMAFRLIGDAPDRMYAGQILNYTLSPLPGFRANWTTEITVVNEPYLFIDTQIMGPYKIWHHQHHFKAQGMGTEVTDLIHYALPFGPLGNLVHPFLVRPHLEAIFDFRKKVLQRQFAKT